MAQIEERLHALGLVLPPQVVPPPGVILPFQFVRIIGNRALISGHSAQNPDGSIAGPFGKVGRDLTVEQGYQAARLTALSSLGSLQRALGELIVDGVDTTVPLFRELLENPDIQKGDYSIHWLEKWLAAKAATNAG